MQVNNFLAIPLGDISGLDRSNMSIGMPTGDVVTLCLRYSGTIAAGLQEAPLSFL